MDTQQTPNALNQSDPATDKKVMIGCFSFLVLVAIACVVYGAILFAPSRQTIQYAKESPDWPTTTAQVTSARVEFVQGSHTGSSNSTWTPEVNYTYAVDGVDYTGNTIRYAELVFRKRGARDKSQAVIDPYSNYPTVTVSYNPEDHSISVLEPGVTFQTYLMITNSIGFMAIGLAVLGFFIWLVFPRKSDKQIKSNATGGLQ